MRALLVLLAACGGSGPASPAPAGPPAASIAVPGPGDVQVATVDGRPVWGSCVADQIARTPSLTRQAALDQCIDFELLAGTEGAQRHATDRDVIDATRTALVRRLLDQFAAKYPNPDSLRAEIDQVYAQVGTTTRPEIRASSHAFIKLDASAPQAMHDRAREKMEGLYARLKDETGLFAHQLEDAKKAMPGSDVGFENIPPTTRGDPAFAPAFIGGLFAIPEVGRVSPVIKTEIGPHVGYHVILLTELSPETPVGREQIFARLRHQRFVAFVDELMDRSTIATNEDYFKEKAAQ